MDALIRLFDQHGPLLVFLNVFVEQLGAPVPAVPTLMVAGALSVDGRVAWQSVLILAVLGSSLANFGWYLAGKRYGTRVLGVMCRISLSPDACVRRTSNAFTKWGVWALLVARFVPGLSAISSPMAGALGFKAGRFIFFDTLGTTLWAGIAIAAGALLHRQVDAVITALSEIGGWAVIVLLTVFALYIAYRWIERQRLLRFVRTHRIGVEELHDMVEQGQAPVIVDVRSAATRAGDARRIPGALEAELDEVQTLLAHVPPDRDIVFYCNCPNEASAANAALRLQRMGYTRVRPLLGGLDAWDVMVERRRTPRRSDDLPAPTITLKPEA
ncbi:MAG: DedA family protein/thiosulfate sulfurtransferase GlpE [Moraxellaceae bacterium]|nr:DedA family protein/thiosulfate sulfurtransferase GlpE [Moraxellaceae bacterium]